MSIKPNQNMGSIQLMGNYQWNPGPGNGQFFGPTQIQQIEGNQQLTTYVTYNNAQITGSGGTYVFRMDLTAPRIDPPTPAGDDTTWRNNLTNISVSVDPLNGSPIVDRRVKWYGVFDNPDMNDTKFTGTSFSNTIGMNPPANGRWRLGVYARDEALNEQFRGSISDPLYLFDDKAPQICGRVYSRETGLPVFDSCNTGPVPMGTYNTSVNVVIYALDAGHPGSDSSYFNSGSLSVTGNALPSRTFPCFEGDCRIPYVLYEDIGLAGSLSHMFNAQVTDKAGNPGTNTFSISLQLPNYAPRNITRTVTSATQIQYFWQAAQTTPPAGYRIIYESSGQLVPGGGNVSSGVTIPYPNPNFHARVKIQGCDNGNPQICMDGNIQTPIAPSTVNIADDYTLALPVTGIDATATSPTQINVSWVRNGNSAITPFEVLYKRASDFTFSSLPARTQAVSATIDAQPNTSYQVTIDAYNGECLTTTGCPAPNLKALPTPAADTVCTPANLPNKPVAGASTASSVSVTVNTNDGNPTATRVVQLSELQSPFTPIDTKPVTAGPIVFNSGLRGGRTYYARTRIESACSAGTFYDSEAEPVSTSFNAPTVTVLPQADVDAFYVTVTPFGSEQPKCAVISYTPPTGPAQSFTQQGALTNIKVPVTIPNGTYTGISARVGGRDDCSDAATNPQSPSVGPAWTRPAKPSRPTATATGPTTIQVTYNGDPTNASGTNHYVKYWPAAACDSEPSSGVTSGTPSSAPGTTISTGLQPGTSYCFKTVTVAQHNSPSWDVANDPPNTQAFTQFMPPASPLTALNTDPTLPSANAFAVNIPRPASGALAPWAQIRFTPAAPPVPVDLAAFVGNQLPIRVAVQGVQPNRAYTNLQARFVASQSATDADANNSPWSTISSDIAWTKPEAPGTPSVPSADASRIITATFVYPTANPAGTKYYLQVKAEDPQGGFDWNTVTPPITENGTPAVQGSTPPQISMQLPAIAGAAFHIRIRAENGSTTPRYTNLDTFSSPDAFPGIIRYSQPAVTINQPSNTFEDIIVRIAPLGGETPSMMYSSYTALSNPSFTRRVEFPVAPDGSAQILSFKVPVANSSYSIVGAVGDPDPRSWSPDQLADNSPAWTLPQVPESSPWYSSVTTDLTLIQVISISTPAANWPGTEYEIEAVANDPAAFINSPSSIRKSGKFRANQAIQAITGLTPNTPHYLRLRVFSAQNSSFDQFSSIVGPITTTPPSARGFFVTSTSNTISAYWDTVDTTGVNALQASARNSQGSTFVSNPLNPPFPAFPQRIPDLIVNLPRANTTYVLTLEKITNVGTSAYPNSEVSGLTKAAKPPVPGLTIGGTNPNFNLQVLLNSQYFDNDINSQDSLYAIEITSNSQPSRYLDGLGGLVNDINLTWKTIAEWTPAAATLQNAGLANTLYVSVCVRKKSDSLPLCSDRQEITTPGGNINVTFPPLAGQVMDTYLFGVPVGGPFLVNFTSKMLNDRAAFLQKISVTRTSDGSPVNLDFSYSDNDQTNSHLLQIIPLGGLEPATAYNLKISSGLMDFWGFPTKQASNRDFFTGIDSEQTTTIYSPFDDQKRNPVVVGARTLSSSYIVIPRTRYVDPARSMALVSQETTNSSTGFNRGIREVSHMDVLFFKREGDAYQQQDANVKVRLTMGTPVSGTGSAAVGAAGVSRALAAAGVEISQLKIYLWTASGPQEMTDGFVNHGDGTVSVNITKSGQYVLAGAISVNLSSAYAYPVPFKPSANHTLIHFVNLTVDAQVRIYTIMGELVKELSGPDEQGAIHWNVTNEDGDRVASGVYVYQIKSPYSEKRGKLMVIR